MLTLDAFLSTKTDRAVYWGTSGKRITDRYAFDSFGMAELVESSVLLHGKDIRNKRSYCYAKHRKSQATGDSFL